MRLSALDVTGFKSFARHARLEFREGITGIVGPNGSGKSNIADAIRWALGEQSMKTLRGKKTEDVIFSGGGSRSRLGMAEVSLTLSDTDGSSPVDAAELVITRRLYRSGESAYLLNNRPVRLLDVAEILAKAGFGQKTYTVIGQGMADAFVNASSAERRAMFEDATGVTSLLLKKEQAEHKLEHTKENLLRAHDVIAELEPRLRSLKRQASRARGREAIEAELRTAEETWFSHQWRTYDETLQQTEDARVLLRKNISDLTSAIERLRPKDAFVTDVSRLPLLRESAEKLRREEQELAVTLAQRGARYDDTAEQSAEQRYTAQKQEERLRGLIAETTNAVTDKEALLRQVHESVHTLQEELRSAQTGRRDDSRLQEIRSRLTDILSQQEELLRQLQNDRDEAALGAIRQRASDIRQHMHDLLATLDPESGDAKRAPLPAGTWEELAKRSKKRDATEQELLTLRVRLAELETKHAHALERLQTFKQGGTGTTAALAAGSPERLTEIRTQHSAIMQEIAALEDELVHSHAARKKTDERLEELRARLHAAEEEKHALELHVAAAKARQEDLQEEVLARLGSVFLQQLRDTRELKVPAGVSAENLESAVRRLREKLGDVGAIDASILKEESETEERVTRLREQLRDLEKASEHLREGIRDLDAYIHRQFSDGMRSMNDAFHTYFRNIFGGGRAGLTLTKPRSIEHALPDVPADEHAPLAEDTEEVEDGAHVHKLPAGVEIRANPPGKKLTSVAQLSGGEKALTSIALLFAILSLRPSPFIVLDEVDAALDEENSRRFARMLSELARTGQFLVITHNRATMHAAESLYGVTMSDDGSSQLLSVRLSEVSEREETALTRPTT